MDAATIRADVRASDVFAALTSARPEQRDQAERLVDGLSAQE
jgi:hypothetical protein